MWYNNIVKRRELELNKCQRKRKVKMTIQELYNWAKENNSENKKIVIHSNFYSALDDELTYYEQELYFSQIKDNEDICITIN